MEGLFSLSTAFISSMISLGEEARTPAARKRFTAALMKIAAGTPLPLTSPMMNHNSSPSRWKSKRSPPTSRIGTKSVCRSISPFPWAFCFSLSSFKIPIWMSWAISSSCDITSFSVFRRALTCSSRVMRRIKSPTTRIPNTNTLKGNKIPKRRDLRM